MKIYPEQYMYGATDDEYWGWIKIYMQAKKVNNKTRSCYIETICGLGLL